MKLIALEKDHYEYLRVILERHSRAGLPAEELPIAADVFIRVTSARELPTEALHLGAAKIAEAGPGGIALEVPVPPPVKRAAVTDIDPI